MPHISSVAQTHTHCSALNLFFSQSVISFHPQFLEGFVPGLESSITSTGSPSLASRMALIMVLLSPLAMTLYVSLLQGFLSFALIVHELFCLLLLPISSSRVALCLIHLCVCRVRHIMSDLLCISNARTNE